MKLQQARDIAERIKARLSHHCERIEIAGSIRRGKPEPGDIEIVCIPHQVQAMDLFGPCGDVRDPMFAGRVRQLGDVIKGDPHAGKYIQVMLPEGIKLDLFTATPRNWGFQLAIRTGSADYSAGVLAYGWVRNGYHGDGGMLHRGGQEIDVPEERDLFRLAGVEWVEPNRREL